MNPASKARSILDGAVVYLSLHDVADALGVDPSAITKWMRRYTDFPPPDILLGLSTRRPGWHPDSLPKIEAWRENREPRLGGRPRHITEEEAKAVAEPVAAWIAAGGDEQERTSRLIAFKKAVDEGPDTLMELLQTAGVAVENPHVRQSLTKPAGNRAGDYARNLVFFATLERLNQMKLRPTEVE